MKLLPCESQIRPGGSRRAALGCPPEMLQAPALDPAFPAAPIEARYALLINAFYPKDAVAEFGKHVLTELTRLRHIRYRRDLARTEWADGARRAVLFQRLGGR